MVMGVSTETPTKTIEEAKTKQKAKKPKPKKEAKPTPTPKEEVTPPTTPPPKEPPKETKPTTKEAKPPTTTPTPKPKKKPTIKTTTWEKFEKFETKTKTEKRSWIKDIIEKAKKEPIEVTDLTKGQLMALIAHVNKHNMNYEQKIIIKYDTTKGKAILAPLTKTQPKTQ